MKTRQQISITVLAAASVICLLPGMTNAQNTYRSDRNGNPIRDDNNGRPGDADRTNGSLTTRQQRVDAGSSASFAYTITNQGRNSRTYRFPSARMFDMEAVRTDVRAKDRRSIGGNNGRRIVWRYSDDQMSGQVLSEFTLRPGQTRSFIGKWQVGRDVPSGTYEVTAFLTPQRDSRTAVSTTRIIVENGRGSDRDDDNRPGRGDNGNNGNNGWDRNTVLEVRDLLQSNNNRYVNQRVTVRGIYRRNDNGNTNWQLDGGGNQFLSVTGSVPRNARADDRITVSGTLRRNRDGRLILQAD